MTYECSTVRACAHERFFRDIGAFAAIPLNNFFLGGRTRDSFTATALGFRLYYTTYNDAKLTVYPINHHN